jgi:hypothetical protein
MAAFKGYQSRESGGSEEVLVPNHETDAPETTSPVDRVELETLRQRLQEQEEAAERAISSAAALQAELASAKSEAEKIGKQYHGFSKEAGVVSARRAAEIATLSTQYMKAERALARQKVERKTEAAKAAEKLAKLERELTFVANRAALAQETGLRRRKVQRTVVGVTAAAGLVCLSAIYWPVLARQGDRKAPAEAVAALPSTPVSFTPQASSDVDKAIPLSEDPPHEPTAAFSNSLNRLDTALSRFPGRAPEEILREASKQGHGCMLSWNEGWPSVVFGGDSPKPGSLSATIDRCADDISHLRQAAATRLENNALENGDGVR